MDRSHKYARVEWERRFLLERFPEGIPVTRVRRIQDLYIQETNLRLRKMIDESGHAEFKLTQKLPESANGARQGVITTMYLAGQEFEVLAHLPGKTLRKTRFSVPPFGIDLFEDEWEGLVLAEAEFASSEEASALVLPAFIQHEVTNDFRFTGGSIVQASAAELARWVAEYGMTLNPNLTSKQSPRGTLDL